MVVLNQLYAHTQMQTTFGAIMLALVDGVPKEMDLKELLFHFVEHRHVVIVRRTEFELKRAQDRAHSRGTEDRRRQHRRGESASSRSRRTRRPPMRRCGNASNFREAVRRDPQHAPGAAHGPRDHQSSTRS